MSHVPSDQTVLKVQAESAQKVAALHWQDTRVAKICVGLSCASLAFLALIYLNNAFGWGAYFSQHVPKNWSVGSACRVGVIAAPPGRSSRSQLHFTCDDAEPTRADTAQSLDCAMADAACSTRRITTTSVTYIKWDESRLAIEAATSNLAREIAYTPGALQVLQSAWNAEQGTIKFQKHLRDPSRSLELWIANYLLSILLGLGLLAALDGALLVPAEKARLRGGVYL
ncbi:MAG: hypothetical protein AAGD43_13945 [Pseudomonadota bacterium]